MRIDNQRKPSCWKGYIPHASCECLEPDSFDSGTKQYIVLFEHHSDLFEIDPQHSKKTINMISTISFFIQVRYPRNVVLRKQLIIYGRSTCTLEPATGDLREPKLQPCNEVEFRFCNAAISIYALMLSPPSICHSLKHRKKPGPKMFETSIYG